MNPTAAASRPFQAIPPLILFACWSLLSPAPAADAQSWITTNTLGHFRSSTNANDFELTPSVSTNIPNSSAYYNTDARLFLRQREPQQVVLMATAKATYGGKIIAGYDVRTGSAANPSMGHDELTQVWQTNEILLEAIYYRGRVYYPGARAVSDEWITVFSSADREKIAIARDSGPIYFSETSGSAWGTITQSAEYEFLLSATPAGSKIVAVISLPEVPLSGTTELAQQMAIKNWYAVASGPDGSRLVLTGGPSLSAPALRIRASEKTLVLSWPASFDGFVLQQSSDISATDWASVTNTPTQAAGEYRVVLPSSSGNNFFRLKKP